MRTALVRFMFGVVLAGMASATAHAQAPVADSICPMDAHLEFHQCALQAASKFKPQALVAGKPDMSGVWRRRAAAHEDIQAHPRTADDRGGPSIIVEPADGLIPYQPWVLSRLADNVKRYMHHNAACLVSGVPAGMYQGNLYQLVQTPQRMVILSQEVHAWRHIPLDGTPFLNPAIRLWRGDSRGTWDDNSLVIETRNQTGFQWLDQRGRFLTSDVLVEERLTMIDLNTIHYTATIQDTNVLTRPFTIAMALRRDTGADTEIWEEACHESNQLVMSQLLGLGYRLFQGVSPEDARAAAGESNLRR